VVLNSQDETVWLVILFSLILLLNGFGGLVVTMLASGTQVRGFEPVGLFGRKIPQHAFLWRGSKAVCPMSQIYVEVGITGQIDWPLLAQLCLSVKEVCHVA
jgi:hypothetical protein